MLNAAGPQETEEGVRSYLPNAVAQITTGTFP